MYLEMCACNNLYHTSIIVMDIHSAGCTAMTLIMKDLLHWQVLLKNADSLNTSSEYQVSINA